MSTQPTDAPWALTEKEKQTLRLIVRGHDAKSIARSLDLSIHTINERLRDARRKMSVSSSREAARLLLAAEGGDPALPTPDSLGDTAIGEDPSLPPADQETAPTGGAGRRYSLLWIVLGGSVMTLLLGLLALAASPQATPVPHSVSVATEATQVPEVVDAAQQWLALVDQGRWGDSYQLTGAAFHAQNTPQLWAATSEKVRAQFGAMISRTLLSEETLPAPPNGYEVLKFRTSFANKADMIETVTLAREQGNWRIEGVMIG